jgi:hypothetical protein
MEEDIGSGEKPFRFLVARGGGKTDAAREGEANGVLLEGRPPRTVASDDEFGIDAGFDQRSHGVEEEREAGIETGGNGADEAEDTGIPAESGVVATGIDALVDAVDFVPGIRIFGGKERADGIAGGDDELRLMHELAEKVIVGGVRGWKGLKGEAEGKAGLFEIEGGGESPGGADMDMLDTAAAQFPCAEPCSALQTVGQHLHRVFPGVPCGKLGHGAPAFVLGGGEPEHFWQRRRWRIEDLSLEGGGTPEDETIVRDRQRGDGEAEACGLQRLHFRIAESGGNGGVCSEEKGDVRVVVQGARVNGCIRAQGAKCNLPDGGGSGDNAE